VQRADGAATARPINVLVADDSESIRALVRITLTSQGWSVSEAATTEAALRLTRETRPDLVVLDIAFSHTGPDGIAVCAELKADEATASIPILVLTAHDDPAMRRRAEAAGADAFVTKPFGPLDLTRVLRGLLPALPATPALGVLLLDAGAVEQEGLEAALVEQRELVGRGTPKRLGDVLLERGFVTGSALNRALLEQMHSRALDTEGRRARVIVIDDHLAVREGLKSLMRDDETLEVVGEAADAEEGLRLARRHQPDIILIDNEMPGGSGLELLPTLRAEVPSAKLVMFSLDGAVRERALAAGAHAFITKDAPIARILQALRPAREPAPPPPLPTTPVPMFPSGRRLRRGALIVATALAAYAGLFFALENDLGATAGVFALVPVVVIGALLGPEAGLIGAVLAALANAFLWTVTGHVVGEPVLEVGGGFGLVILLLLGFASGAMRGFGLRFDPRRRRVEAIAAAAHALGGLDRGEFFDVFLDAMLRVVPGDLAMLFSNAAGDARFVAASRPLRDEVPGSLVQLVRDTMYGGAARTIAELGEGERPATALHSAALVPVSVAGLDVRGVLVVFHRDRGHFGAADLTLIQPFAQYLWVVLRGPIPPRPSVARAKERTS
jgi:DNA-binding NarL/FixJ family response regulator